MGLFGSASVVNIKGDSSRITLNWMCMQSLSAVSIRRNVNREFLDFFNFGQRLNERSAAVTITSSGRVYSGS